MMPPFLLTLILLACASARVIEVPESVNISSAILAASDSDIIMISAGVFTGPGNCNLNPKAMNISIIGAGSGSTIIDCAHSNRNLILTRVWGRVQGIQFRGGIAPGTPLADIANARTKPSVTSRNHSSQRGLPIRRRPSIKTVVSVIVLSVDQDGEISAEKMPNLVAIFQKGITRSQTDKPSRKKSSPKSSLRARFTRVDSLGGCLFIEDESVVTLSDIILTGCRAFRGAGSGIVDSAVEMDGVKTINCGLKIAVNTNILGAASYIFNSTASIRNSASLNNFLITTGNGLVYGAGLHVTSALSINLYNFTSSGNIMQSSGTGKLSGCGFHSASTQNVTFHGGFISNNTILTSGSGITNGAGLYISNTKSVKFTGVTVESNTITANLKGGLPATSYYKIAETNKTAHCSAKTEITDLSGRLTDGSSGLYSANLDCTWDLTSTDLVERAFGRFRINVTKISLESNIGCSFDYVALYDGQSSNSPLIGKYCGFTPDAVICSAGTCPKFSEMYSTSTQLFVKFHSDASTTFDGFSVEWDVVAGSGRKQGASGIMPTLSEISIYAAGAGMCIESSTVNILSAVIRNNKALHSLFAVGAGVSVSSSSVLKIDASRIYGNTATGSVSGGGGLAALDPGTHVVVATCIFDGNMALTFGQCTAFYDDVTRCAYALGGALLSAAATASVESSVFISNQVACSADSAFCSIGGGAFASTRDADVLATKSNFSTNFVPCAARPCAFGQGGAAFSDSGVLHFADTIVELNSVFGIGGGGGVFITGTSTATFSSNTFSRNNASEGGGIWASGSCGTKIRRCNFNENNAVIVGGAIAVTGDASISLTDSILRLNTAGRSHGLIAYNDNQLSKYEIENTTVLSAVGIVALLLGQNRLPSIVFQCSDPGTVLHQDFSDQFLSITFSYCSPGSYSPNFANSLMPHRVCLGCPYAGICLGGNSSSSGLRAIGGHWGTMNNDDRVTFYRCPPSYCCRSNSIDGCAYDHCEGNRIGRLCGRCPEGMGLRFFTESCGLDSDCHDSNWAVPVLIIVAVIYGVFLVLTTGEESDNLFIVLLFFYQVLSLVKSTPWKYTSSPLITTISSFFNLVPPSGTESKSGTICLFPGMTASQKLGSRMIQQGIIALALGLIFIVHYVLQKKIQLFERPHAHLSRYLGTLIRLLTISYTTVVLTSLQMLQCVWVEGEYVWFWDASIHCFDRFQIWGIIGVIFLFPIPLIIMITLYKLKTSYKAEKIKWKRTLLLLLTNGFRHERRYWLGISLYRRFLLVFANTMITDNIWKSMAMTVLCVSFLILQIAMKPFKKKTTEYAEIACLTILSILSASSAPQLAGIQFGSASSVAHDEALEWVQFLLSMAPITFFCLFWCFKLWRMMRERRKSQPEHHIHRLRTRRQSLSHGTLIPSQMLPSSFPTPVETDNILSKLRMPVIDTQSLRFDLGLMEEEERQMFLQTRSPDANETKSNKPKAILPIRPQILIASAPEEPRPAPTSPILVPMNGPPFQTIAIERKTPANERSTAHYLFQPNLWPAVADTEIELSPFQRIAGSETRQTGASFVSPVFVVQNAPAAAQHPPTSKSNSDTNLYFESKIPAQIPPENPLLPVSNSKSLSHPLNSLQ